MDKKCVYLFLADGFETVEALATVDVLRRASLPLLTISVMGRKNVTSAQGVMVEADQCFEETDFSDALALVLPGGAVGSATLSSHEGLSRLLSTHNERGGLIGAICAAPEVPGRLGLLRNLKVTCYPGYEKELVGAEYTAAFVQEDANFITACGPAASWNFGFALLARLSGEQSTLPLRKKMQFRD